MPLTGQVDNRHMYTNSNLIRVGFSNLTSLVVVSPWDVHSFPPVMSAWGCYFIGKWTYAIGLALALQRANNDRSWDYTRGVAETTQVREGRDGHAYMLLLFLGSVSVLCCCSE